MPLILPNESAENQTIVNNISCTYAVDTEDAENGFNQLLNKALENPTAITRQGKPMAVVLSGQEYKSLQHLDAEESEAFSQELLNTKD